jgi:hypothetical protein
MNTLSAIAAAGFVLISLFIGHIILKQLKLTVQHTGWTAPQQRQLLSRSAGLLIIWLLTLSFFSIMGITQRSSWFPLNIAAVLIPPFTGVFAIAFSRRSSTLLKHLPLSGLTYLQSFRVVVEMLMWGLFLNDKLPVHMTFEGKNYDILAGLTAPVVALTLSKNKIIMILWNAFSMALLLNIFVTGVLSAPTPFQQFFAEPGSALLMKFPFVLLPGFLIPVALLLHLLSLRKLFGNGHSVE